MVEEKVSYPFQERERERERDEEVRRFYKNALIF
jgi:hypothetical protein